MIGLTTEFFTVHSMLLDTYKFCLSVTEKAPGELYLGLEEYAQFKKEDTLGKDEFMGVPIKVVPSVGVGFKPQWAVTS